MRGDFTGYPDVSFGAKLPSPAARFTVFISHFCKFPFPQKQLVHMVITDRSLVGGRCRVLFYFLQDRIMSQIRSTSSIARSAYIGSVKTRSAKEAAIGVFSVPAVARFL